MGIYVYREGGDNVAVLEELITGNLRRAEVASGYAGEKGEIWYARVLPPPNSETTEHVVFTTPYILLDDSVQDWLEYFDRTLPATGRIDAYELHMKFGPTQDYWNEYVLDAYVNNCKGAIFLTGLPDVPESLPHR